MIHYERIVEHRIDGMPLGRNIRHDSASLRYRVGAPSAAPRTVLHKRQIPILDQMALGSCHDDETEILTESSWLPFQDLTTDNKVATVSPESGELLFENPIRVVALPWDGAIYTVRNEQWDFRVTGDHQMLVRCWDERARTLASQYQMVTMKDLGWYVGLMRTVTNSTADTPTYTIPGIPGYKRDGQRGDLVVPMRTWLGFLGIYLAEGTMLRPTVRDPYKFQIAAFKEREKAFVRELLSELGIQAQELPDRFAFRSARIYRHMEALGLKGAYASEKCVPDFVFGLSPADIESFLQGHREGDGSIQNGTWTHHTTSPRMADDISRLILLAGGRPGTSVRQPRTATMRDGRIVVGRCNQYAIRHNNVRRTGCIVRKRDVRVEHYRGMVYCAEVPTHHTLVTRRNGKILISGNCTGNAMVGCTGTSPNYEALPVDHPPLDEALAVEGYSLATTLDDEPGYYSPGDPNSEDTGSDGLSAAKAAKQMGLCSGYLHALSLPDMQAAMATTSVMAGTYWLDAMDHPNSDGLVQVAGDVRGGHEYQVIGMDVERQLFLCANSWGPGWGNQGFFSMTFAGMEILLHRQGDCTQLLPLSVPPPQPTPTDPAVQAFLDDVLPWARRRHGGLANKVATAIRELALAEGYAL